MTAAAAHRPVGVAIVAIVAFVQAILAVLSGLGLVIERNDADLRAHIDGAITTYGVAAIIWGALAFIVALGLWAGANWARIVVAILELFAIGGGIYLLFAWGGTYLWSGIWKIVVGCVVLYFLYNARAQAYFTQGQPA